MKNFDWCAYTYKHRKMFVYIANKLIKDEEMKAAILERAKYHDVDKLLLYMFLDQDISQKHHVVTHKHHLECNEEKSYIDLLETVIDYECSPYTKPDKPLNAFDFLNKLLEMKLVSTESERYQYILKKSILVYKIRLIGISNTNKIISLQVGG